MLEELARKILSVHINMYPLGGTHNAAILPVLLPEASSPADLELSQLMYSVSSTELSQIWCLKE